MLHSPAFTCAHLTIPATPSMSLMISMRMLAFLLFQRICLYITNQPFEDLVLHYLSRKSIPY
ncbi:MAG TPA: hypothetical protein VJ183_03230 [Chloroflexia bacterium]|nr:hypothetical protein [Chloroflexia bacterium]